MRSFNDFNAIYCNTVFDAWLNYCIIRLLYFVKTLGIGRVEFLQGIDLEELKSFLWVDSILLNISDPVNREIQFLLIVIELILFILLVEVEVFRVTFEISLKIFIIFKMRKFVLQKSSNQLRRVWTLANNLLPIEFD